MCMCVYILNNICMWIPWYRKMISNVLLLLLTHHGIDISILKLLSSSSVFDEWYVKMQSGEMSSDKQLMLILLCEAECKGRTSSSLCMMISKFIIRCCWCCCYFPFYREKWKLLYILVLAIYHSYFCLKI